MEFANVILRNFGAFIPGMTSGVASVTVKTMREGCGQLLCSKKCLGTADIYWPQVLQDHES
jgi:hypothetical protein